MLCPRCKNQLIPVYKEKDLSLECYTCFNCGKKYDTSSIKIYSISFLVKDLLRRKPYLKKNERLLQYEVREELKRLDMKLNDKTTKHINRTIKKLLNRKASF